MSAGKACKKSLTETCTLLQETTGITLCKQSLNERFSAKSVTFLKKVVEELIEKQSDQYQLSTFSNFK
ncbi:hypothetical protein QNI22_23310, partial [Cytophagaceae bacterium BD1B2-1]|nr:hypothetical protein [Xanthocytophaga agilis]